MQSITVFRFYKLDGNDTPFGSLLIHSITQETVTKRWNLVCGNFPSFGRVVQMVFFIGNMVGVFLIGPFSDYYGRKLAYMTAITAWSIVTVIGYLVNNPYIWMVTRFLAGGASQAYNTVGAVYM